MKKLRPLRYRQEFDPEDAEPLPELPPRLRLPRKEFLALGSDYQYHAPQKPSKGQRAALRRLRRLREAQAALSPTQRPDITADWWYERKQRVLAEEGRCRWCGATQQLTVDHIIPCSAGGTHARSNLQCLCEACNLAKGNLTGIFSCPV